MLALQASLVLMWEWNKAKSFEVTIGHTPSADNFVEVEKLPHQQTIICSIEPYMHNTQNYSSSNFPHCEEYATYP